MTSLKKFFQNDDGKIVIWQWPNIPLWGFIVFRIGVYVLPAGKLRHGSELLSDAFLAIWAYLEITDGSSPFRRVLGTVVAIVLVAGFFM